MYLDALAVSDAMRAMEGGGPAAMPDAMMEDAWVQVARQHGLRPAAGATTTAAAAGPAPRRPRRGSVATPSAAAHDGEPAPAPRDRRGSVSSVVGSM
jgi:hypothetical protein